jgi:hypothetical protein
VKIYLVNEDIDLGYHVKAAFLCEDKAKKFKDELVSAELMLNKHFKDHRIFIEGIEVEE